MFYLDLSLYLLNDSDVKKVNDELFLVTKWNWDYEKALKFQEACQKIVYDNKNIWWS